MYPTVRSNQTLHKRYYRYCRKQNWKYLCIKLKLENQSVTWCAFFMDFSDNYREERYFCTRKEKKGTGKAKRAVRVKWKGENDYGCRIAPCGNRRWWKTLQKLWKSAGKSCFCHCSTQCNRWFCKMIWKVSMLQAKLLKKWEICALIL